MSSAADDAGGDPTGLPRTSLPDIVDTELPQLDVPTAPSTPLRPASPVVRPRSASPPLTPSSTRSMLRQREASFTSAMEGLAGSQESHDETAPSGESSSQPRRATRNAAGSAKSAGKQKAQGTTSPNEVLDTFEREGLTLGPPSAEKVAGLAARVDRNVAQLADTLHGFKSDVTSKLGQVLDSVQQLQAMSAGNGTTRGDANMPSANLLSETVEKQAVLIEKFTKLSSYVADAARRLVERPTVEQVRQMLRDGVPRMAATGSLVDLPALPVLPPVDSVSLPRPPTAGVAGKGSNVGLPRPPRNGGRSPGGFKQNGKRKATQMSGPAPPPPAKRQLTAADLPELPPLRSSDVLWGSDTALASFDMDYVQGMRLLITSSLPTAQALADRLVSVRTEGETWLSLRFDCPEAAQRFVVEWSETHKTGEWCSINARLVSGN